MRIKVSDIEGDSAYTAQGGVRLYDLIEPAIARGESVVLDFAEVVHFSSLFFSCSLGRLIETDTMNRLLDLLRIENLIEPGQDALESATRFAIRRREDPKWAAAIERAAAKLAARE